MEINQGDAPQQQQDERSRFKEYLANENYDALVEMVKSGHAKFVLSHDLQVYQKSVKDFSILLKFLMQVNYYINVLDDRIDIAAIAAEIVKSAEVKDSSMMGNLLPFDPAALTAIVDIVRKLGKDKEFILSVFAHAIEHVGSSDMLHVLSDYNSPLSQTFSSLHARYLAKVEKEETKEEGKGIFSFLFK